LRAFDRDLFDGNEEEQEMSATTDTPASITTRGGVETPPGVSEFDGGMQSARTAEAF
jgi:hypothetical protein